MTSIPRFCDDNLETLKPHLRREGKGGGGRRNGLDVVLRVGLLQSNHDQFGLFWNWKVDNGLLEGGTDYRCSLPAVGVHSTGIAPRTAVGSQRREYSGAGSHYSTCAPRLCVCR